VFPKTIEIRLEKTPEDWFIATCDDLPGLFVSHPDIKTVIDDIPDTIKALYLAQYSVEVDVAIIDQPEAMDMPFMIPVELLSASKQASV